MNIKELLGIEDEDKGIPADRIGVLLTQTNLPLDLALEMVFRQQSQLFNENSSLKAQLSMVEALVTKLMERIDHLHNDIVEVQAKLEAATTHPVDRPEKPTEDEPKKLH